MAKVHLKELLKKYNIPENAITGENYQIIIQEIINQNTENVSKKILRLNKDRFKKAEGIISLPDLSDVLPKRAIQIKKSADQGNLIMENLRNELTRKLRNVLEQPDLLIKRGKLKGTLRKKALEDFEKSIKESFLNYTKKDKKLGVPKNVKTIATTELRGAVNDIKDQYMNQLQKKNPDMIMQKTWKHNRGLVKDPREWHEELDGVTREYNQDFVYYNKKTGRVVHARYPHDPRLPASEVINCQCECIYEMEKIVK